MRQTMKFVKLVEYKMKNLFLEKLYTKCGGETIPRPFSNEIANTCFYPYKTFLKKRSGTSLPASFSA